MPQGIVWITVRWGQTLSYSKKTIRKFVNTVNMLLFWSSLDENQIVHVSVAPNVIGGILRKLRASEGGLCCSSEHRLKCFGCIGILWWYAVAKWIQCLLRMMNRSLCHAHRVKDIVNGLWTWFLWLSTDLWPYHDLTWQSKRCNSCNQSLRNVRFLHLHAI